MRDVVTKSYYLKLDIDTYIKLKKIQARLAFVGRGKNVNEVVSECVHYAFKDFIEDGVVSDLSIYATSKET